MLFIHCKQKNIQFYYYSLYQIYVGSICYASISVQRTHLFTRLQSGRFIKIDPNLAGLLTKVKLGNHDPIQFTCPSAHHLVVLSAVLTCFQNSHNICMQIKLIKDMDDEFIATQLEEYIVIDSDDDDSGKMNFHIY